MPVQKLTEFAKNGDQSSAGLSELNGFPGGQKPQRSWFNGLLNRLTTRINEVIDVVNSLQDTVLLKNTIVNDSNNDSTTRPVSANQVKLLNENKVNRTDVVNNLTTSDAAKVLSAAVGATITQSIASKLDSNTVATSTVAGIVKLINSLSATQTGSALDARQGKVLKDLINLSRPQSVTYGALGSETHSVVLTLSTTELLSGDPITQVVIIFGSFRPTGNNSVGNPQFVNFPITFPNRLIGVWLSENGADSSQLEAAQADWSTAGYTTTSRFAVYTNYATSACKYLAIGI